MFYALFNKTDNLTPDELNNVNDTGECWLHTGIVAGSRAECEELLSKGGFLGEAFPVKIVEENELSEM